MNLSNEIVLICKHSFHKECLSTLYNNKCNFCFDYLSTEIKKNIKSLDKRLSIPLRENEIPLFEDENNNNNENDDDENIENILERIEYDVENQYCYVSSFSLRRCKSLYLAYSIVNFTALNLLGITSLHLLTTRVGLLLKLVRLFLQTTGIA